MKAKINEEEATIRLEPETLEDLWVVTRLVQAGDEARGTAWRRFKARDLERAESGEKKRIRVVLRVENIEYAENANRVRLTGVILRGEPQEFAPAGEHQTLDVEIGTRVEIKKKEGKIGVFERKTLDAAKKRATRVDALIIAMDDEGATLAQLTPSGVKYSYTIESEASKREPKNYAEFRKKYFSEILKACETAVQRGARLIVAGPGFAKDDFKKYADRANAELAKKILLETTSNAERNGVNELVKRGVAQKLLGEQKQTLEWEKFEELKKRVARNGLIAYGNEEVAKAVEARACDEILVLDEILRKDEKAQRLVERAERGGANVFVFDSRNEAAREFAAFGIACFLRYKL
jgi:protein pelota